MATEYQKVMRILRQHGDKNFVRRIMDPNIYPRIKNPDGTYSTHLMSVSEADGRHYVYPLIQQDEKGDLIQMEPQDAFRRAMEQGEAIEFYDPDEAEWFSRRYKAAWE